MLMALSVACSYYEQLQLGCQNRQAINHGSGSPLLGSSCPHYEVSLSKTLHPKMFQMCGYGKNVKQKCLLADGDAIFTLYTWKHQAVAVRQEEKGRRRHRALPGSREAFVPQVGRAIFRFTICEEALSVGIDVREPTGGAPSPRAHLPLLPQSAVPCGAPDVAGRIIHTHTLMKVSIWPLTHTLSPGTIQAWGHWEASASLLLLWHLPDTAVRYCCTSSLLSIERSKLKWCTAENHLAVTER